MNKSRTEEEYFVREDAAKLRTMALEREQQMAVAERERLKVLHWMCCARCGLPLSEVIFKGVTIDKCFHCGGVFLDNGELEKLCGKESHLFKQVFDVFKF